MPAFLGGGTECETHIKQKPKLFLSDHIGISQPDNFLIHMAGKRYKVTLAVNPPAKHQFDILPIEDDINDIECA